MSEQIDQQNNTAEQPSMFQVVNAGFTTREAIEEAKRCLHCKIPQCKKGCPIENDIPDFVHSVPGTASRADKHVRRWQAGCSWR